MKPLLKPWGPCARLLVGGVLAATLASCGGGKSEGGSSEPPPVNTTPVMTQPEAARFLAQATYGPTEAEITSLSLTGFSPWIEAQFAKPVLRHRTFLDERAADLRATQGSLGQDNFRESYWMQALAGEDQLRQRATFALSQIFVISFNDAIAIDQTRGVGSYYDMLAEHAFGNYRDLLEGVTKHPMMGAYLTHLRNQKEDDVAGRVPDENYAREVMQLLSIGLYELNPDGTVRGGNSPTETYTDADVKGLAKVFTGWSWYAGPNLTDRTTLKFFGTQSTRLTEAHPQRDWRPMQPYNQYHSVSAKSFLGTTIPASGTPDAEGDLRIALDTLFNHPNVGPFIGKQLIQRLVTSNPSPAYVGRVAAAFNNNGSGVRGDMKSVWRAILLDPEARNFDAASTRFGKVREPLLRLAHLLRAFKAQSTSGLYTGLGNTDNITDSLGQTVMRSPSVFNFYRPGYTPPNSAAADAGLVAPELQLANEVSVAGYLNFMRGWVTPSGSRDINPDYSAEIALARDTNALVDRINLLLMSGQMSEGLRGLVVAGVNGRTIPTTNQTNIDTALRERVQIAIFLTMASPEYMVQK